MDRRELLDLLRSRLQPHEYDRVARELAAAEAEGASAAALEEIARAASWLKLHDVPPVLSQDLHGLLNQSQLKTAHDAVLVFDSRSDRDLVGVRGGADEDGWSQTYTSPVADIALDIWTTDGTSEVEGHVMSHGGDPAAYRVSITGPTNASVDSDALGRFRVEGLPRGSYLLKMDNPTVELTVHLDVLPT